MPYYSEMQCGEGVKWFCLCVCRAGGGGGIFLVSLRNAGGGGGEAVLPVCLSTNLITYHRQMGVLG